MMKSSHDIHDTDIIQGSNHETFTQGWFDVGPASQTVDQQKAKIAQCPVFSGTPCICLCDADL